MNEPLVENKEPSSEVQPRKRKRSTSTEEVESLDNNEQELHAKLFATISNENETDQKIKKIAITRKRKYMYKSDPLAAKKCRFYYLNELMTKPRRPKISKIVETLEKSQESVVPGKRHKLHFSRTDGHGNAYLTHRSYLKSDLFFNDEKKCNYEASKKLDLNFHIVDEIALEGLDGITLEAFWKRLKNVFPNYISKTVADRIWRMICNNKHINFYILKEPREKLIAFDRCKYMDIDAGVFVEPFIEFKDIYPLSSVNGTEVRGSCSTFNTRKENNGVRKFSMEKTTKLYDQRLVFVADQTLRNKALINEETDPNLELLDVEYCMLERIGRSREQGELTQGKGSLPYRQNDNKSVYHNRKTLIHNFLIVNQFFYIKSLASQQNISGGLVHLSRFYNKRKTKQVVIMEQIASILRERQNNQLELTEFRKYFGRNRSMLKVFKTAEFRRFFRILVFPYTKLYPHATKQEYMNKSGIKEKQIRVLRMLDPCANVTAILESRDIKEVQHETPSESIGSKLINHEYLREIFMYILSSGKVGVTIQEIHDYLRMDFYSVRMAVRKLLLRNVISSNKIDLGRQQSLKFFAKCFSIPGYTVTTEPKNYQLTEETRSRVLKGYEKISDDAAQYYLESEPPSQHVVLPTCFKLDSIPSCCTAFLTETIDASSEELTIYDIVIKGRDKLLLIESNLFEHYMSEWDDFVLKRDDFSKLTSIFHNGFGKIIFDFLSTVRINESIEVDNVIVFNVHNINADMKIGKQPHERKIVEINKNFSNPHSDYCYVDSVAKIYLFEAMFNEFHVAVHTVKRIQDVFHRLMASEGKKKRESDTDEKSEPKIKVELTNNIVMEKYMGANPVLKLSEEEDGIKTEIFASTEPTRFVELGARYETEDIDFTQRYINRTNLILDLIQSEKIVKDVRSLFKKIQQTEGEEGYDKKVCKKSVDSIVLKLVTDGYIKIFKLVMTGKNITRSQIFVCQPNIDVSHSIIKSTIEQLKLKFYVTSTQNQKTITVKKKMESPFSMNDVKESIVELKHLTTTKLDNNYKFDKKIGKVYGYSPKFVRMRVLHEHLFFVIRELWETDALTHREVFELCKSLKIKMSSSDVTAMPPVYRREVSWKMFIPPLPRQANWPKGWALACDIILRMPLSVFVKIYNVSYEIPELEEHLKHPVKRHYLLKQLPARVINFLLHKRKYFYHIYEIICHLCYVGLVQLGPRSLKEKDQVFMYLNSKASLLDTCSSKAGYNMIEDKKYKKIQFEFKTPKDIEIYWSEMLRICLNTQLGKRKILDGQCVTIEDCTAKPAMMDTLKAKTFEGAVAEDNGEIPGDHKGAAGLDSALWTFIKRNWLWSSNLDSKSSKNIQSQVTGLQKEKYDIALPQPIQYDLLAKGGPPERKVYLKPLKKMSKPNVKSIIIKKNSKKKQIRKIIAPRKKRVREYYDAVDKSIMKKYPLARVDWDEEEDQLLRYSRAATVFLCPEFKKQFIPYNIIRDVLHRVYPKSKNKTARAVQRRIYVLLTHDENIKIMEANVENLLNSDAISKYFNQIHHRYKYDIKITDSQMYIAFIYLMAYVLKHRREFEFLLLGYVATFDFFSESNITDFEQILQSEDDGNVVPSYTNPHTVEEITKNTIKSVIHCSIACRRNSVGWTFHLSHIYKKFQDELIRIVVAELKKSQLFVKNYEDKGLTNNWPIPLKFSHLYNVMKSATYVIEMYREAYQNFVSLVEHLSDSHTKRVSNFIAYNELSSLWEDTDFIFDIPEKGIILNPEIDDHSDIIEELSKRFRLYLDKIYEKIIEAKNKNKDTELPEDEQDNIKKSEKDIEDMKIDVRHLIFRIPYLLDGNLESYFKKMRESSTSLEINNYIYLMIVDLKKYGRDKSTVENLTKFIDDIEEENIIDDQDKLMGSLSKIVFAIQNIQRQQIYDVHGESSVNFEEAFKLWESEKLDDVRTRSKQEANSHRTRFNKNNSSGMEVCINRAQEGDFPSLEEIKEGMMAEGDDSKRIPHITDLIVFLNEGRFPELDTDNETIEKMKDHFIIQYPKVQEFIIENLEELKNHPTIRDISEGRKIDKVRKFTENVVKQPQMDQIIKYIRQASENPEDIKVTEDLLDFIKDKKEMGSCAREIKDKFFDSFELNLVDLLNFLTDLGVILRTGISSVVYVHHEYQSEWLVETFMLSSHEQEVFTSIKEKHEMKKLKSLITEKLETTDPRRVQLKPWTKLDGSLNQEQFQEWLCIILSRCVEFPNIPFLILSEQFHYIKPVDVYYLLEILQELGCVDIYLFNSAEHNIFTERNLVNEGKATCLDNFEDMFIKPTYVSGLCFGFFVDKDIM